MIIEKLDNGIEVILQENHFSRAVAIQAWVGTGSLAEKPNQRGMAHFVEHMLFKGTARYAVGEIAATVEACGGDINAYTTFDRTVYYLTLASYHAGIGVDLLADAIFNSQFAVEQFESERSVILEEINRSLDDPGSLIGTRVFEVCYGGTEAGRPIIGSAELVKSYARDELFAFYKTWYHPENLRVVVVGDFDSTELLKKIDATFGQAPRNTQPPVWTLPTEFRASEQKFHILRGDYKQPRLEVVFPGPALEDSDAVPLDLAAFALGAGEISRLNMRLRDRDGVLTRAHCSLYSPQFRGIFELSALMAEDQVEESLTGLIAEIEQLKHNEPISIEELDRARANLQADRVYRDELVEGQAKSLGFAMTTRYRHLFEPFMVAQAEAATPMSVTAAARRWLDTRQARVIVLVPEDSAIDQARLAAAFDKGLAGAPGPSKKSNDVKLLAKKERQEIEAEVIKIRDGMELVYRRNPRGKLFTLVAATEGGLRGETPETAGVYNSIAHMLALGTESIPHEDFVRTVEGKGATLEGFSGKDSFGLSMGCLDRDWLRLVELFFQNFLHPLFPKAQWESLHRSIRETIKAEEDSPANICIKKFQETIFGAHPYRHPIYGRQESVDRFNEQALLTRYHELRDQGRWVFAAVGNQPADEVADLIRGLSADWQFHQDSSLVLNNSVDYPREPNRLVIAKDREQAHLVVGFPGISWRDPDRHIVDVLVNLLGGQGGRLFLRLRDRDGLAYTVAPLVGYGVAGGIVASYIACAPDRAGEAEEAMRREMYGLLTETPSKTELERAISYIIGNHDLEMQRTESQGMTMALMELYGCGYNDFLTYPEKVRSVTREDILRVVERLFRRDRETFLGVTPQPQLLEHGTRDS